MKVTKRYVIIPELLGLTTNVADFIPDFSIGAFMYKIYEGKTKINLDFKIVKDFDKPKELVNKLGNFWGQNNTLKIYYEKKFLGPIRFKMLVEKKGNNFIFIVNRLYFNYCRFRIDRVYSPGGHLFNVATLRLANCGFTILHGACISKDDKGILLVGGSKIGKSLTAFSSISRGYKFLSEDILVLNKRYAYSSPLVSYRSCYFYNKNKSPSKYLSSLVIFHLFSKVLSHLPFEKFLKEGSLIRKAKIKYIYILEKGDNEIIKLGKNECLRKILALNKGAFFYYHDILLRAFSYFNPEIKIEAISVNEEKNLSSIVNQSDCYLLKTNNPTEYIALIDNI